MYYLDINHNDDPTIPTLFKSEHIELLVQLITDNEVGLFTLSNDPVLMNANINEYHLITPVCNDVKN